VLLAAAISALIIVPQTAELGEIGAALRQTSWPWVAAALGRALPASWNAQYGASATRRRALAAMCRSRGSGDRSPQCPGRLESAEPADPRAEVLDCRAARDVNAT
jgi:hypothetical protein